MQTGMRILFPLTMALLLSVSAAAAQSTTVERDGSQKPVREVGNTSWPKAKSAEERKAEQAKAKKSAGSRKIDAGETTGGSTSKADSNPLALKPAAEKDAAQPAATSAEASKPEAAKPDAITEAIKNDQSAPAANSAPKTTDAGKADEKPQGAASIRLGTNAEGRVAVNDEQTRQIKTAIRKLNVKPASVTFSVRVGTVVPREQRLTAVSAQFVDVLPQFRGYSFFTTREEIVIVEPGSMKIVALIPVESTATAAQPVRSKSVAKEPASRRVQRTTTTTGSATRDSVLRGPPVLIERTLTYPGGRVVIQRQVVRPQRQVVPPVVWEQF